MSANDSSVEFEPAEPGPLSSSAPSANGARGAHMRPQHKSFVRMRAADPFEEDDDALYAEPVTLRTAGTQHRELLANDQLNLTVNLLHLQRLLQCEPGILLSDEAAKRVADRAGDLEDVRGAIETLLSLRDARLERLLLPGASLSAYLKGIYLYSEGIVEAYEEALAGRLPVDGAALRFRLGEASQFYFDGLVHPIRAELDRGEGLREAQAAAEELFFAATFLHEQVLSAIR